MRGTGGGKSRRQTPRRSSLLYGPLSDNTERRTSEDRYMDEVIKYSPSLALDYFIYCSYFGKIGGIPRVSRLHTYIQAILEFYKNYCAGRFIDLEPYTFAFKGDDVNCIVFDVKVDVDVDAAGAGVSDVRNYSLDPLFGTRYKDIISYRPSIIISGNLLSDTFFNKRVNKPQCILIQYVPGRGAPYRKKGSMGDWSINARTGSRWVNENIPGRTYSSRRDVFDSVQLLAEIRGNVDVGGNVMHELDYKKVEAEAEAGGGETFSQGGGSLEEDQLKIKEYFRIVNENIVREYELEAIFDMELRRAHFHSNIFGIYDEDPDNLFEKIVGVETDPSFTIYYKTYLDDGRELAELDINLKQENEEAYERFREIKEAVLKDDQLEGHDILLQKYIEMVELTKAAEQVLPEAAEPVLQDPTEQELSESVDQVSPEAGERVLQDSTEQELKSTENKVLQKLIDWLKNNDQMVNNNNELTEVLNKNNKKEALKEWLKNNNELDLLERNEPIEEIKELLENKSSNSGPLRQPPTLPPQTLQIAGGLIVDPETGMKHSINDKMGKSLLKRYIKHYKKYNK